MHNSTPHHARNDPTDHWIKVFSFLDFENEFQNSRGEISLFLQKNLDFKYFLDSKMSLGEEEINRFND